MIEVGDIIVAINCNKDILGSWCKVTKIVKKQKFGASTAEAEYFGDWTTPVGNHLVGCLEESKVRLVETIPCDCYGAVCCRLHKDIEFRA